MGPREVAFDWKICPQKGLTEFDLRHRWAQQWDSLMSYVLGEVTSPPASMSSDTLQSWAVQLINTNGVAKARSVIAYLRKIEKEIELTPEERVRWDEAVEPLISASREALRRELFR